MLRGNDLNNVIRGLGGDDVIYGYGGNDLLDGGDGNDLIIAGAGNSILLGGAGNDTLIAGPGRDLVIGGAGRDVLVVDAPSAARANCEEAVSWSPARRRTTPTTRRFQAIMAEWTSRLPRFVRVRNLLNGRGSRHRLNGSTFLNRKAIESDHTSNTVVGLNRHDWFRLAHRSHGPRLHRSKS